jgi:hypothetical protein
MGFSKIILIFNTVKFLKFQQVFYQIFYRLKFFISNNIYSNHYDQFVNLNWDDGVYNLQTYNGGISFDFLNTDHEFEKVINWNLQSHNKLWLYNLNYFDYLNQKNITKEQGLLLINDFIKNYTRLKDAKESYPSSLRIINFIKFISKHNVSDPVILGLIKEDANRLSRNLEFQLLGNHLLENGFALWFASKLFNDKKFHKISTKILKNQLSEQIFNDGGHFELSPMYHSLMLYRILDCINLSNLNPNIQKNDLVLLFKNKASKMVSWLNKMTFRNGDIPLFNDSANGINPTSKDILEYAKKLGIKNNNIPLSDSGYRDFRMGNYELILDIGEVGASYQPAHAHADTFNYELYIDNSAIITDTGISTYSLSENRIRERSTMAHNTVTIDNENSSQVWSAFRVAKRASVEVINDSHVNIIARHDGYKNFNIIHQREWTFDNNQIIINDIINNSKEAKSHIHFHPDSIISSKKNIIYVNKNLKIYFKNLKSMKICNYYYNFGFNKQKEAKKIELIFERSLTTTLKII